ncbi:MAG: alanine dehydrogenase [Saprospiraceae bacterium]|nr:MAG: alanine dehydrogenase [Saprospiraceae bacterium]
MKVGIIREGKTPPDARVLFSPNQCANVLVDYHQFKLVVQPSPIRCFHDEEYLQLGVPMSEDIQDCDLLLGIKEVPIHQLIPNKAYCFFSHTLKKQAYNRDLLRAILDKNIQLIDYEAMKGDRGRRLIAFGYYAGMVGAYNAIWTYGQRSGAYQMKRLKDCFDYAEAKQQYAGLKLPPIRIVLTGTGRVGKGAADVLHEMGIRQVEPAKFLKQTFNEAVFTRLECRHYAARKDGSVFSKQDFYDNPELFKSVFGPYTQKADLMINGIFWNNKSPVFFSKEEMKRPDFNIQVIADVTCDIAPVSSIPSTLKASTIADPVFGYDPQTEKETAPFQKHVIDMMTIDNLPSEMPRDASKAFGNMFLEKILPEFLKPKSLILERATIAKDGKLGPHFQYLREYVGIPENS